VRLLEESAARIIDETANREYPRLLEHESSP